MSFDSRRFRDALGEFVTGITLVTTVSREGEPIAVTVNSFNSVSLDPPLVLFSLARSASRFDDFMEAESFVVNILAGEHEALSTHFARPGNAVMEAAQTRTGAGGLPRLSGAVASFECRVDARHDGGDHVILVGRVGDMSVREGAEPLVYHRGSYASLAAAG